MVHEVLGRSMTELFSPDVKITLAWNWTRMVNDQSLINRNYTGIDINIASDPRKLNYPFTLTIFDSSFTSIIEEIFFAISPTMLSLMMWLFFGSVEIWHSYSPSSRACTYLTCRVQVSDASTKSAWNLSSGINMVLSTERICESLLRIHDTFCVTGKNRLILIISSTSTCRFRRFEGNFIFDIVS